MDKLSSNKFDKDGRKLQEFLGSTKDHTNWAKYWIGNLTLIEGTDYQIIIEGKNPHRPKQTYWFTPITAARIANSINASKVKHPEKAMMVKDNIAKKAIFRENGRLLQEEIGSTKDHTDWAKYQIKRFGLMEGNDFSPSMGRSAGGRPKITYWFTKAAASRIKGHSGNVKDLSRSVVKKDEMIAKSLTLDQIFNNPRAGIAILEKMEENMIENKRLNERIKEIAPKADYYDEVLRSESTFLTTDIAKDLGMNAVALNLFLRNHKVQYKIRGMYVLYKEYQDKGYTKTKTYTFQKYGIVNTRHQTEWTEKGREFIIRYVNEHRMENKSIR